MSLIKWFNEINMQDINLVGGKNASLGEMYSNLSSSGIKVPNGFAITTNAYDLFMEYNKLNDFVNDNINFIKNNYSLKNLKQTGMKIRNKILNSNFPQELEMAIIYAYIKLSNQYNDTHENPQDNTDVAVRSSGTAEDLPDASFAGQQETYLNVRTTTDLLLSVKRCIASLYTDRAISYRKDKDISCLIKLSVGVQKMVRSDLGSAGVAFSIDTESGFKNVIVINGAFGLGELVVSGQIKPDEIILFKPKLNDVNIPIIEKKIGEKTCKMVYGTNPGEKITKIPLAKSYKNKLCIEDDNILKLGKWIQILEKYYTNLHGNWCPLDVEWAIDGLTKELYLVQARPETVISKTMSGISKEYHIVDDSEKNILIEGVAVGDKITTGKIKKMYTMDSRDSMDLGENVFEPGSILVTEMTDPNWEPIMKISSGIITNKGGRTCHASIVARELGIPAIVGTLNATEVLDDDQLITLSCGEGEIGKVYEGRLNIQIKEINFNTLPKINTSLMLNVASPEKTFKYHNYPVKGVGLVRQEFIFNNYIKIHPLALLNHEKLNDKELTKTVEESCVGYESIEDFFIKKVAFGISKIAATFYNHPVIVRFSDFKSNEYYKT